MASVLVSGCLLGWACRFDGADKRNHPLLRALEREGVDTVPFCPEEAGGLGTPRPKARLEGGDGAAVLAGNAQVLDEHGADVTGAFLDGARAALARAVESGCRVAYLKERSPSCGCVQVHTKDGPVEGCGVTTAILRRAGIATISID